MTSLPDSLLDQFGPNAEYVAAQYRQWLDAPMTVSQQWRDYFASLGLEPEAMRVEISRPTEQRANGGMRALPWPTPEPSGTPVASAPNGAAAPTGLPAKGVISPAALVNPELAAHEKAEPIRGVANLIVQNMEASLGLPVATSYRFVPVKVLEENRKIINNTLQARGQKVSFTHLISWAIIEALKKYPSMNATYALIEGKPHRIVRDDVNFGVAIDIEKRDGSRSLIVPNLKAVDKMDFQGFMDAYSDLVNRARAGNLTTEDYANTTITLTNPGTIGTVISAPRLMEGQGTIVATGAIQYPAEFSGVDPARLAEMGVSKVMGLSSTYDHRIIQGAESGMFLLDIHRLLMGEESFYDQVFSALAIPYPPVRWEDDRDKNEERSRPSAVSADKQLGVQQLIRAYRVRGHLLADLNPLDLTPKEYHPDLDPATYGLTLWDLDREFLVDGMADMKVATLRTILDVLRQSYSSHLGIEYMNIQEPEERRWIQRRVEQKRRPQFEGQARQAILKSMSNAEAFEQFLHRRYTGAKRFSLEGAEAVIPMLEKVIDHAATQGVKEAVMGMAHRGRLNVLKNILQKPARDIFSEFDGTVPPDSMQGSGDVKYHLGAESVRRTPAAHEVELTMMSNPSHLEAVDPVVEGFAHARQRLRVKGLDGLAIEEVLPILVHGDAAFAGQGVVAETLNLSQLRGYRTGGTVHVIINNQIGFTTNPFDARSTPYPTDVAKGGQVPIIHINGDDPEAAVFAAELAIDYRNTFHKDVVLDLICYRRWGHNEGDEPSYTQPQMYEVIRNRLTPREYYAEQLVSEGVVSEEEANTLYRDAMMELEGATEGLDALVAPQATIRPNGDVDLTRGNLPETGVDQARLLYIADKLGNPPEGFDGHPKLMKLIERRALSGDPAETFDWATAELLALGALLMEKVPVRLSGQDSGRGTFSQRHSVWHSVSGGPAYIALNHLSEDQAPFRVWDSLLSEEAVLGFEYGYALGAPTSLVLWEAQFGDFANGAQVQIDQFISSSRAKWNLETDLVLLLPHGYEGQGPEHSSARLERFLQLSADDNWRVTMPTTAASYFHLLRRQKLDDLQRPLIVMTPKSLLRLPAASSTLPEISAGTFQYLLDDPEVSDPESVERLIFLSGKLYYDVQEQRKETPVAVVRLEQLYPYPSDSVRAILARYPHAKRIVWAQEEPQNMGSWTFIQPFLQRDVDESDHAGKQVSYVGRPRAASPATGSLKIHVQEQAAIVEQALGRKP
ncbi:MAG: multifunctional oxoglutarate decarboxylase/oxoglutarate dehydrogenase thiamine pyrophosphate-binding subunit/dihydrolipoyllysine-residue succinyltransferase subunit [Anaerolineales bacterium]|nr:multifunctional oxoglutarate decarboxylase/oxoglutarate dehydrogenase thiamine pyrophosphate-binding subunit/dihydrolipoyllysine-residue succinyltransferase subunit [Anaerolineales bacterium]MCB9126872.1 multifunctional oxoglutarate decarboxylase/oxoglutarate dehydrogenase thiamine pyrophosphate-binding subunit/dihydrolipoyllysine-residue succinyltransferase subunit [Ardenticatenales bacterium]MCB9172852.1 multifunctional oxoglutarate decarboxylase/oxoglutarate dehydrogenase thiamine pyrophosp